MVGIKDLLGRERTSEVGFVKKTGNVGIMGFAFTNFQADNYGTSSGDDEGNCVYN